MKIKKGTKLFVRHTRKGNFKGVAIKDFDTDDEWYQIAILEATESGLTGKIWNAGEETPCRKGLCEIEVLADKEQVK